MHLSLLSSAFQSHVLRRYASTPASNGAAQKEEARKMATNDDKANDSRCHPLLGGIEFKELQESLNACHRRLDRARVPSATWVECRDPECKSQLYHRLNAALERSSQMETLLTKAAILLCLAKDSLQRLTDKTLRANRLREFPTAKTHLH
jgi:hypothetical protein